MPITGMTTQDDVRPRLPMLGQLRKGAEKTANKPGAELDHWRFTSENPDVLSAFQEIYGDTPRLVQVFLPYKHPDDVFETWSEVWSATTLEHRCDGKQAYIWREGDKMKRGLKPCPGGHTDGDYRNDAVGRLNLVIPELIEAGHVGYVVMITHSINDIVHIASVLWSIYESAPEERGLTGIKFDLRRVKQSISTPGFGAQSGNRSRVDKWLVKISPSPDWMRVQLSIKERAALAHPDDEPRMLPAATVDDLEDSAIDDLEDSTIDGAVVMDENPGVLVKRQAEYETVAHLKTPRGTFVVNLTNAQLDKLRLIRQPNTEHKEALKNAAIFLLAELDKADWAIWNDLYESAVADGISVTELPPGSRRIDLWHEWAALRGGDVQEQLI